MENQEKEVAEVTVSTETKEQELAKYTDGELNDIIAKKEGKLLSKFGAESKEELEKKLAKLKEYEDLEKTEAQKRDEKLQEFEGTLSKKEQEIFDLKAQIKAKALNISDDDYEDAIILAKAKTNADKDFETALNEVAVRFQVSKKEKENFGVETKTEKTEIKNKKPRVW